MTVMIRHKGIEHGVMTDAHFIGARICAIQCAKHCAGCFNQDLLGESYVTETIHTVFEEILDHELNEGIILGGLEWTEQPEELREIVRYACSLNMHVMVYTHLDLRAFLREFWEFREVDNVYVKCGEFRQDSSAYFDEKHDVMLASTNQIICKLSDLNR